MYSKSKYVEYRTVRITEWKFNYHLRDFQPSVSSVDGWHQEGHLVKSRSTGSMQYPWMDNCLAVHSWVLVDYPDADFSR